MTELQRPVERWRTRTDQADIPEPKDSGDAVRSNLPFYMAFACGFVSGVLVCCSVLASLIY